MSLDRNPLRRCDYVYWVPRRVADSTITAFFCSRTHFGEEHYATSSEAWFYTD